MHLRDVHLQRIFDHLMPPPGLLDPSLYSVPLTNRCRFIQTFKSLTLVCRGWNRIATPYLYCDIAFRRVGQVPALIRTLKHKPNYHAMINQLTFSCYIPDQLDLVINQGLSYLLTQCPDVHSLSFFSPFIDWLHATREDRSRRFEIPDNLLESVTSVTSISYSYPNPDASRLHDLSSYHVFSAIPNVISLTLTMDRILTPFYPSCLLAVSKTHLNQIRANPFYFPACFVGPNVTSLRFDIGLWFPSIQKDRLGFRDTVLFVTKRLPNLHIIVHDYDWSSIQTLLQSFPEDFMGQIDVWAPSIIANLTDRGYRRERRNHPEYNRFNVRFLDHTLRNFPSLPLIYPPEDHTQIVHIYGISFVTSKNHVYMSEVNWDGLNGKVFGIEDMYEENMDGKFAFTRICQF